MFDYELIVRLNGTDAAFLPIFRNRSRRPKVCSSVSLFVFKDRRKVHHTLLDCGPGVGEAIQADDLFPQPFPIDWLVLSHAHPDHFLGIDALLGDQQWWARARNIEPPKLKLHAHPDTHAETLGAYFPFRRPSIEYTPSVPGTPHVLWTDGTARLEVTQVEVVHYRHSVASLFRFDGGVGGIAPARVACLFDFAGFHPRGSPQARAGGTADHPELQQPDLMVVEATTWRNQRETVGRVGKHMAFETLAPHLLTWKPLLTRIVHYAGFEDAAGTGFDTYLPEVHDGLRIHPSAGPVAEWELDTAIHHHLAGTGHPDPRSVRVGRQMETLVVYPRLASG